MDRGKADLSNIEQPCSPSVQDLVRIQRVLLMFEARVHQVLELVEPDVILHVQGPILGHDALHHSLGGQGVVLPELQHNERPCVCLHMTHNEY